MSGFFTATWSGRPSNPRALHLWAGPLGVHLFWRLWHSRFDWCREWRQPA